MYDRTRYLEEYQKMSDDPIVLSEDDDDDLESEDSESSSDKTPETYELEETISKWTNYIHGWQDRWLVLKNGTLSYYKSRSDIHLGCRGSISLGRASIQLHEFDDLRFDISINDSIWYLRTKTETDRHRWTEALEQQRSHGENGSLQRQGSMLSLHSSTSLASTSSFKKGRGLKEKLAEMETFHDILCRQVDTLQSYFDSCAESAPSSETEGDSQTSSPDDPFDGELDGDIDALGTTPTPQNRLLGMNGPTKDKSSLPPSRGIDFKGEAFTFKATTTGIIATLSHCIDLMRQREDQWQKRLEKEQEKRRKAVEAYKVVAAQMKKKVMVLGGPDYEEGPHSLINEDEFFDAVDAALDLNDKVEAEKRKDKKVSNGPRPAVLSHISEDFPPHQHRLSSLCDEKVEENIKYAFENIEGDWDLIHQEGEMKIYKSEQEIDGVVCDPLKAIHTIRNITGHEMCHTFWDVGIRMDWDATIDFSNTLEVLGPDTVLSHQLMKRVWPATARDTCFASHIRKLDLNSKGMNDVGSTIVVNFSTDHPDANNSKYIRAKINVSMLCQTFLDPPDIDKKKAKRSNLVCKIFYVAHVNPGGWAPASVLRAVYKRVYPQFVRRFSIYVQERCANKPIMW
ncbi:ceramide transfer protein-like [Amphiura filiformis]|uniref:ceramide transfer protein-like n=1 Tax=Amphiura filiformis TaxID=82378 RepID=UPI003B220295